MRESTVLRLVGSMRSDGGYAAGLQEGAAPCPAFAVPAQQHDSYAFQHRGVPRGEAIWNTYCGDQRRLAVGTRIADSSRGRAQRSQHPSSRLHLALYQLISPLLSFAFAHPPAAIVTLVYLLYPTRWRKIDGRGSLAWPLPRAPRRLLGYTLDSTCDCANSRKIQERILLAVAALPISGSTAIRMSASTVAIAASTGAGTGV